jgi:hypothetical protein
MFSPARPEIVSGKRQRRLLDTTAPLSDYLFSSENVRGRGIRTTAARGRREIERVSLFATVQESHRILALALYHPPAHRQNAPSIYCETSRSVIDIRLNLDYSSPSHFP